MSVVGAATDDSRRGRLGIGAIFRRRACGCWVCANSIGGDTGGIGEEAEEELMMGLSEYDDGLSDLVEEPDSAALKSTEKVGGSGVVIGKSDGGNPISGDSTSSERCDCSAAVSSSENASSPIRALSKLCSKPSTSAGVDKTEEVLRRPRERTGIARSRFRVAKACLRALACLVM